MYANEQLRLCFYVLVRYSLFLSSEIMLKQLFAYNIYLAFGE